MRRLILLGLILVFPLAACAPMSDYSTVTKTELKSNRYAATKGFSGVSGIVELKSNGQPIKGAYVNIYPNTLSNLLGPSQYISAPTDEKGAYKVAVPPGTYYVVARKRATGLGNGPLATGDFYSDHQRILAEVRPDQSTLVDLAMVQMKAPMFFKKDMVATKTETGIRGVLVDAAGKPVPGSFAIAYSNSEMQRLPDFASTLTNQKGEFVLYLPAGGQYYLAARIHAWDMPRPGEPYGKYGGDEALPIVVPAKQFVDGIRIVMNPFTGTYKEGNNRRPF